MYLLSFMYVNLAAHILFTPISLEVPIDLSAHLICHRCLVHIRPFLISFFTAVEAVHGQQKIGNKKPAKHYPS